MSTKKSTLIGFGYIRINCREINNKNNTSFIFPIAIIPIIIEYFQNVFEWDLEKCTRGNGMIITNNGLTVKSMIEENRTICAKNLLSSDEYTNINWEITLRDFTFNNHPSDIRLCFAMGFIEYHKDIKKSIEYFLGSKKHQLCIYIDEEKESFQKYHGGRTAKKDYEEFKPKNVRKNDKFEIKFNFIKKECSFYWNDKFVAVLHDKLPDKLYPALSCYSQHEFECTKWELFYCK